MSAFDYLSVLISLVLGLGITQLLSGFARWLELRARFRVYPPAIVWAAFLFLVHVQTWWAMFGLRGWSEWNFLQFSLVLLQPTILFLLASLAFPGSAAADQDPRVNFHTHRTWFFGLLLGLLAISLVKDYVRSGALPGPANLAFHGGLAAVALAALLARRDLHQLIIALAGLAVMVAYIVLLFANLA